MCVGTLWKGNELIEGVLEILDLLRALVRQQCSGRGGLGWEVQSLLHAKQGSPHRLAVAALQTVHSYAETQLGYLEVCQVCQSTEHIAQQLMAAWQYS